jgi:anti-sigma-K factor RskA
MSRESWEDRAAAYALGALDPEERASFEAELLEDQDLRRHVADLEATLAAVADDLGPRTLPPALKQRVLERAREERRPTPAGTPAEAGVRRPDVGRGPVGRGSRTRTSTLPWVLLAASVAGLAWMGFETWTLRDRATSLGTELAQMRSTLEEAQTELARLDSLAPLLAGSDVRFATLTGEAAPSLRLLWNAERRVLLVAASDLPAPAAGRTYQLWGIRGDDAPVSLGTFSTGPAGTALVTLSPEMAPEFDVSAVTDEPDGGSSQPTTQPFLVGSWRSAQD